MANIREISPNNYALFNNGESLTGFHKIERVADNSNYYCLWPTSEYFYLYHIVKKKFALNSSAIADAYTFVKIEHYSEKTGTFIAYRKDEDYVHILFEDGYAESTTFCFIGEETNEVRPVKTCSDRWFFYDTRKRKYLYHTGSKGYQIDGCLEKILTRDIFIINKNNRGKQLALYVQGKAPVFSRDYFEAIELVKYSTFIGKLYNKNIYCIIKNNNIAYPIGYYTSSPKYVEEHNLFIAAKGESYCLVKGGKEIQNHQWKSDTFIFHSDYAFNKQCNSSSWKIFSIHNGHEIPTNFKNIRITDDKELYLLAEIDGTDKRISIEEINELSNAYFNKFPKDRKQEIQATPIDKSTIVQNDSYDKNISKNTMSNVTKGDKKDYAVKESAFEDKKEAASTYNKTEQDIDINYYIFVPWVSITDNRITSGRVNCDNFRGSTFIVWFILEEHTLIITESRRTKVHNILYLKEKSPIVEKLYNGKHFWTYRQLYPISWKFNHISCSFNHINELFFKQELSRLATEKSKAGTEICQGETSNEPVKKQETLSTQPLNKFPISTNLLDDKANIGNPQEVKFTFDQIIYKLKIDEEWNIDDIFYRKRVQHRSTEDVIAILYDPSTDHAIKSKEGGVYYLIYGEGKDKRFDQYFGQNTNSLLRDSINDKNKRILLFKRNAKKELLLQDEVKCVGFETTFEKDDNRTVIIFKLKSILRYQVTTNLKEPEKEQVKTETKETINKEKNDKPSNLTNMSKLQELYDTKKKLQELGIELNAELEKQLSALEEELIQNEIVPIISQTIVPLLKPIKRKITFVLEYNSEEDLHISISNKSVCEPSNTNQAEIMSKNLESTGAYKKLKVTLPNGIIVCEKKVIDTLVKVIQYFGAEKVAQLCEPPIDPILKPAGINLVTKKISPKYEDVQRRIENDWLVFSCTNTITKKRQIEIIANALNVEVTVEIV